MSAFLIMFSGAGVEGSDVIPKTLRRHDPDAGWMAVDVVIGTGADLPYDRGCPDCAKCGSRRPQLLPDLPRPTPQPVVLACRGRRGIRTTGRIRLRRGCPSGRRCVGATASGECARSRATRSDS